jgi:hypothetical protein
MSFSFSNEKGRDRFLKTEMDPSVFVSPLILLSIVKMNIVQEEIVISLIEKPDSYASQVYSYYVNGGVIDYKQLSSGLKFRSVNTNFLRSVTRNGELPWTTMPENYPFTVDYML